MGFFMWALLVLDVGAFVSFLFAGRYGTAGIWFGYSVAQLFWVAVTLEVLK